MKFKTDYETFRGAIATIGKAVKKNGINEMAVVKMEVKGNILELSTNGNIGCIVQVELTDGEDGEFVVSFSELNIFSLRKCTGKISASSSDDGNAMTMMYRDGNAKTVLTRVDVVFNDVAKPEKDTPKVALPFATLKKMVAETIFAASREETNAGYGVHLNIREDEDGLLALTITCLDGLRVAQRTAYAVKNGDYTGTVIVPPEQFKTMIDIVDASDDDANIDITIDSGKLYMDYSKKHVCIPVLDKKYPAVQRIIDGEIGKDACKFSITIDKRDFIESISCVQYVLQETGASGVNSSAMLKFKEKELEIGGIGLSQYGEKIEAETVGEVPEPAYFNPDFLKEAASIYPKDKITIGVIEPKAPIWMCCGDSNEYVYCVLPRKRE